MKSLKKVAPPIIAAAVVLNIAVARYASSVATPQLELLKADPSSRRITFIYLGMLGETAPLAEIAEQIPGQVFAVRCGKTDYSPEKLALFASPKITQEYWQEVNIIGISMGATAAIQAAQQMQEQFPDGLLGLYLLDPCVGSNQINLVKMPGGLMRGLSGAITLISHGLGMLSFIPVSRGHSLANIQGEIATSVRKVPTFDERLWSITHVTISANDWLVDPKEADAYFCVCESCDFIDASHADFMTDREAWLSILEQQGLFD